MNKKEKIISFQICAVVKEVENERCRLKCMNQR